MSVKEILSEGDLNNVFQYSKLPIKTVDALENLKVVMPRMLIEKLLPIPGATVLVGSQKAGKTLLAVQMGMSIAAGEPLCRQYAVHEPGPVLLLEQDDPNGEAGLKDIFGHTDIPVRGTAFHYVVTSDLTLGPEVYDILESEIVRLRLKLLILDSYTALRGNRPKNVDLVKAEASEFGTLDQIGKRTDCSVLILHHISHGRAGQDWSDKAAGTYAIGQSTEAQIVIERFRDLPVDAPERLVRARGRRADSEMLLRFQKDTLNYEYVLDGSAASLWPEIQMLQQHFRQRTFTPKSLCFETGMAGTDPAVVGS